MVKSSRLISIPFIVSNFVDSLSISFSCHVKFPLANFSPSKPRGKSSQSIELLAKMEFLVMGGRKFRSYLMHRDYQRGLFF